MSRDALWYFSLPYVGTPTALSSWSLAAWHREIIAKKRKARSMLTDSWRVVDCGSLVFIRDQSATFFFDGGALARAGVPRCAL